MSAVAWKTFWGSWNFPEKFGNFCKTESGNPWYSNGKSIISEFSSCLHQCCQPWWQLVEDYFHGSRCWYAL